MAFSINNHGIEIYLDIKYDPNNKEPVKWCKVDYSFKFGDIINYQTIFSEIFLNEELPALEQFLSDYINDKLKNGDYIIFTEPDFCFEVNCSLKWIVSLWHEGCLCGNEFSTPLDKEQAAKLRDYLREIVGAKNDNNS